MNKILPVPEWITGDKGGMPIIGNHWSPPQMPRIDIRTGGKEKPSLTESLYYPMILDYQGVLWI